LYKENGPKNIDKIFENKANELGYNIKFKRIEINKPLKKIP
jgi:hypothetical protein